jgi:DNA repair protein RecN (Recombination protein N)
VLQEITIKNFALIGSARLVLSPGLNVLTGETGAGKSILIDAVEIALGGRASSDVIRTGTHEAIVDVVFDVMESPDLRRLVADMGLAEPDDPILVISRHIPADGRSTCRVNGRTVSLTNLRRITELLIDIHGQHEHQSLLKPERHIDLLDAFGGEETAELRAQVTGAHRRWRETLAEIEDLAGDERDRARRLDLLRFQAEEIERAELMPGEEEELLKERNLLVSAEKRQETAARAYAHLYGTEGAGPGSAHDQIGQALKALEELAALDPEVRTVLEVVQQAAVQLDEASRDIRRYRDAVHFDQGRLAEVEARLDLIGGLKRKYGSTEEEVIAFGRQARTEYERLTRAVELAQELGERAAREREELDRLCALLTRARRSAAERLGRAIEEALADLEMKGARLVIGLAPLDPPGPKGADRVEFLFSANPGEPPKPLSRIASGGETSRVMLALKAILAEADEVPTMIFDEIDTGVGGGAAQAVGEKLATIALSRQVVCVTHLARIASLADAHHLILKETADGRTTTRVKTLTPEEREHEVARMLAGHPPTPITLAHAREMLEQGRAVKERVRALRSGAGALRGPA